MGEKNNIPQIRFNNFDENWEVKEFKEIFSNLPNNTLSRAELNYQTGLFKNVHYGDVLIKFGELLDVKNDRIPFISNDAMGNKFKLSKLQNGDIIIADTAEDESVGKCTELINAENENVVSGLHTIPVRPIQHFASKYLGYYLNSSSYHDQLLQLMQGIKVLSISKSALKSTVLVYPQEKLEQSQIGTYFQNLDKLITLQQQKHDKLVTLKKAMLDKMFPKEGADVPEIRFKGFTKVWEEKKIAELGDVVTGSTPSTQEPLYYSNIGIPWVTPTDILDNITYHTAKYLSVKGQRVSRLVPKNTILVTSIASIGKNTILGTLGSFNQQINGLIPDEKICDSYFLFTESVLWSNKMKRSAASGTMQIVNKTEFSELKTFIPTIAEQIEIGSYFQNLDKLISLHQQEIQKLKNIKKACLEKMFV